MLVISTGIRPNAEIGARCGLTVERAIVTDDQMRSVDDPDVYVVGECAQHRGKVYGLVQPLWEQAQVLADHITGRNLERRLPRLETGDEAEGHGRGAGLDGQSSSRRTSTTRWCSSRSRNAASTRS